MAGLWKHRQSITAVVFWVLFLGSFAFSNRYKTLDSIWVSGAYFFLFIVAVFSVIQTFRDRNETGQFSYRGVPRWLTSFLGDDDTKTKQGENGDSLPPRRRSPPSQD